MKRFIIGGFAAMLMAGGLTATASPASAGCINPGWAGHPFAQMCDDPIDPDGMWERCLMYYTNGILNPAETDCYTMSANDPPKGDPILSSVPTHIDP
ncbi:CDGP domain-containing protein [Mycobacterium sp.]|uniref:CDGP domain-containing protein n=1 Tax=Mycobacterium sp. TaxID=1785 RepID=UPI003C78C8E8